MDICNLLLFENYYLNHDVQGIEKGPCEYVGNRTMDFIRAEVVYFFKRPAKEFWLTAEEVAEYIVALEIPEPKDKFHRVKVESTNSLVAHDTYRFVRYGTSSSVEYIGHSITNGQYLFVDINSSDEWWIDEKGVLDSIYALKKEVKAEEKAEAFDSIDSLEVK